MKSSAATTALLLILLVPCSMGYYWQSGIPTDNTLLTCLVPGLNGESVEEETLRLSLQPGPSGTVWLPVESE